MLDLSHFDLDDIATALADQTDYEHRWLVDPRTGEMVYWTSDTGIDGENPVDLDDLDLIHIDPLPSYVWYEDMADFAELITDERAGRRLARAIRGRGAFPDVPRRAARGVSGVAARVELVPRHPRPTAGGGVARRQQIDQS